MNKNKIQAAYEALKQVMLEEGVKGDVTVWVHQFGNPDMTEERAFDILAGLEKVHVRRNLDIHGKFHYDLVEWEDNSTGGFRITVPKETSSLKEWPNEN